jgi:hypothetical protein
MFDACRAMTGAAPTSVTPRLCGRYRPDPAEMFSGPRATRPADLGEQAVVVACHVSGERAVADHSCGGHLPRGGEVLACARTPADGDFLGSDEDRLTPASKCGLA